MRPLRFTIYQSAPEPDTQIEGTRKADWRWHVKAGNGEILASGEGYTQLSRLRQTLLLLFAQGNHEPALDRALRIVEAFLVARKKTGNLLTLDAFAFYARRVK